MNTFIPVWIIGAPVLGILILSFSFRGPSAMGGSLERLPPRDPDERIDPSAPLLDPMHADAPRRRV